MKLILLTIIISLSIANLLLGQVDFKKYFEDKTMRIDYFHTGNATSESEKLDRVYTYGVWPGSKINLVNSFNLGAYFYKIVDQKTGKLIYAKGFDSYFREYQTTTTAIKGNSKTFHESALIPSPKKNFYFILEKRDSLNVLHEIFREVIDPHGHVTKLALDDKSIRIYKPLNNGSPEKKIDIAIIAEGYTEKENKKFQLDLKRVTDSFFSIEPLKSYRSRFNVNGVFKPSLESGVTEPGAGIIRKTAVNASFDALGSERYLLTEDNKSLRDVAAYVPHDAIFIIANTSRYGGGGIYNFYCVFTSDNINSNYLMTHEFGHSFFGLADEYYTSSTSYNNFYPQGYEPLEPNITAETNKAKIKWRNLLTPGIELPTPWEKEQYDMFDLAWQKERTILNEEITDLKKKKVAASQILAKQQDYDRKSSEHIKSAQEFLSHSKYHGQVGAFEGAGYTSTGLYRPAVNCIMFTQAKHFCPVCTDAMVKMINWYTNEQVSKN